MNTGGVVLVGAVPAVIGIVDNLSSLKGVRRWAVSVGGIAAEARRPVRSHCRRRRCGWRLCRLWVACIQDTTLGFAAMSL